MAERSTITENQFKKGDRVLVIGTYTGHPEYTDDVIIEFKAHESVTMPESYVNSSEVINLDKSHLPEKDTIKILEMLFSTSPCKTEKDDTKLFIDKINKIFYDFVDMFKAIESTGNYKIMKIHTSDDIITNAAVSLFKSYLRSLHLQVSLYGGGGGGETPSFDIIKIKGNYK